MSRNADNPLIFRFPIDTSGIKKPEESFPFAEGFMSKVTSKPTFAEKFPDGVNKRLVLPEIEKAQKSLEEAGQDVDANTIFTTININLLEERRRKHEKHGLNTTAIDHTIGFFRRLHAVARDEG